MDKERNGFRGERNSPEKLVVGAKAWLVIPVVLSAILLICYSYTQNIQILIACSGLLFLMVIFGTPVASFYLILFLLPSLSLFKSEGMSFSYATVFLFFCLLKHVASQARKMRLAVFPFISAMAVIAYELTHAFTYTKDEVVQLIRWVVLFFYAVLLVIDSNFRYDHKRAVHALLFGFLVSAVSGIVANQNVDLPVVEGRLQRFEGVAGDPNGYAMMGIIIAFFLFSLYRHGERRDARYVIGFVGVLLLCLKTYSRGFIITFSVMVTIAAFYVCLHGNKRVRTFIGSTVALAAVLAFSLWTYLAPLVDIMIYRWTFSSDINDISSDRIAIAKYYWNNLFLTSSHLLWGSGLIGYLRDYNYENGTHNTYLELLVSWGIIGAVIFGVFLYSLYVAMECKFGKVKANLDAYFPLMAMAVYLMTLQSLAKYSTFFLLVLVIGNIFYRRVDHNNY
ncbi:MAG: O-antigen ligase family protein [bacterium]